MNTKLHSIERAIMNLKNYIDQERGRATSLAQEIGVSLSYLSQMASGKAPISPEKAVLIEQKTNGLVTRKKMFVNDWQKIWPELKSKRTTGETNVTAN
jgi:DNA-binding transcriptional regulator YdaS (Cro superfamily)